LYRRPVIKLHDAKNDVNNKGVMKEEINIGKTSGCPRCDGMTLRGWSDLTVEEQEVVRRLPSGGYSLAERQSHHRWCTRCWFEQVGETETLA
jgi:hypothetical protein